MEQKLETLIVGAGALGAMYAGRMAASGVAVGFVADDQRAARLREHGRRVNGAALKIPALSFAAAGEAIRDGRMDAPRLLVVALKDRHLPACLPEIPGLCGPDTTVLSVMNGIDSERQLAGALNDSLETGRVLYCMTAGMDAVRQEDDLRYTRLGTVFLGRARNPEDAPPDPRVAEAAAFLERAGIPVQVPADMEHAIWNKFMLNVGINQWSAVLGASYGVFHRQEAARELMRLAMREVIAVAAHRGVTLSADDMERWFGVIETLGAEGRTSMLQDVLAGRPPETAMFAGRVVELGEEHGVPTPINHALALALETIAAEGLRMA